MKVLISVLNYNNFHLTKKCVKSILPIITNEKILIIDNNSTDNSYSLLINEFKKIKIIKAEFNGGYARGHKISVDYAIKNNFDLIWILNNDLVVRENTLSELLKKYNENGTGIYGSISLKHESPDIVNFGGGKTSDISKPLNYNSYEGMSLHKYNQLTSFREVQSIEGSSFIIPVDVIKKFGFMREDFFMYGEETEYCFRLKKNKIKSFLVTTSIIIHKGAESLKGQNFLKIYYRRRNILLFEKVHYGVKVFKNLNKKFDLIIIAKYFFKYFLNGRVKDDLYYYNIANLHALINRTGKL